MKIITVFKTHFDIGFTELSREVVERYSAGMLDEVLNVCESTADFPEGHRFVWTMAAWPLIQALSHATADRRLRAERLIESGQLTWHALAFTTHTEFAGSEELMRSLSFSKQLSERYRKPYSISAKMTDVPGHTYGLVSVLAKAGIKFLHLGCNPASTPPDVPMLFWWEAPDKSRVLTFYNKGSYGSGVLPPKGWKYPVWLNMNQTNDNIGPQTSEIVDSLLGEIGDSAELCIGRMDDFYNELIQCDLSDLPVIKKDLADSWIHGVMTYPAEVSRLRRARKELLAAEKFYAYLYLKHGYRSEAIEKELADCYENAILFDEHTWGLDVKTHLGGGRAFEKQAFLRQRSEDRYKKMEDSWAEQRERVQKVSENLEAVKRRLKEAYPQECSAVSKVGSSAVLSEDENRYSLANEQLRLFVDKRTGSAVSLTRKGGRELLSGTGVDYNIIGLDRLTKFQRKYITRLHVWAIYDFGRIDYPEMPDEFFLPRQATCKAGDGCIRAEYRFSERTAAEYGMPERVEVCYRLKGDRMEITLGLKGKPATPFVESGNFIIGYAPDCKRIVVNKTGTTADIKKDIEKDCNHVFYCLEDFADIEYGEESLGIVSYDTPLFSNGEEGVYEFRERYEKPKANDLRFNLFNNMWGTNFPQWIEGDLAYRFDLIPHEKGDYSTLFFEGEDTFSLSGERFESALNRIVRVEGAKLYSAKVSEKGVIVRIRETSGKRALARVFAEGFSLTEVDLYERPLKTFKRGEAIKLAPLETASFLLTKNSD